MSPRCPGCGHVPHRPNFLCNCAACDQEPFNGAVDVLADDDEEDHDTPTFEIGDRVRLKGQPASKYDHGVVIRLDPFEDAKGRPHTLVEAAPDRYARHVCIESNRLTLIDYSSEHWRTARAIAECELKPHQHYQVDLGQQVRGKQCGPYSEQTFSALAYQLVHCRDVGPAEITLNELVEWRPGLEWVQGRMIWEVEQARDKVKFCANATWVRDRHLDEIIQREVGPHGRDDEVTYVYPWLRTWGAQNWTFHQFYDQLPDCRGCWCA